MQIKEILVESLSRVAFHYTRLPSALKILTTGQFELSSVLGSAEQQYAPKGQFYFFSTTRTRHGGYHDFVGDDAVLFVLDGNWFNRHYQSKSVDYWLNRDPSQPHHRQHEAEDRVFSKDPTIPIGGITAIHVYVSPSAEEQTKARARQVLIAAKKQSIPVHLYNDIKAWKNFDTRQKGNISALKGKDMAKGYATGRRGYLLPWIELIRANNQSQLSKTADKIRYNLMYTYDRSNAALGLTTDLSNARKPSSGPDRQNAIKIINYMKQNNLKTINDLVNFIANKWQSQQN